MTTSNHTAITLGAAANASVINAPLGQLDAAMGDVSTLATTSTTLTDGINEVRSEVVAARDAHATLDQRLDAMVFAGGNVATLTNGAASAGQKIVDVDSTTGFIAGAYVAYELVGGTLEYNSIDTVTSPTRLTMDTNVGTGGIADDTYISMISPSEYQAAEVINHSGALTLPNAMEYAAGDLYNVKAYGAIGNGSTDDTTAIQAAIDAAEAAAPAAVYFPPATYVVTGLTVDDNVTLYSSSGATTIKQKVLGATVGTAMISVTGEHVTIRDLRFNGQKDSQPADGFSDDWAGGANNTGRSFRAAIKADGNANTVTDLRVEGCRFEDVYGACVATLDVDDVVVEGCRAEDCFFELAFLYRSSGTNSRARVTNNIGVDIASGHGTVNANGALVSYYSQAVVTGNQFFSVERNGIKLEHCTDVVCSNNVVHSNSKDNFGGIQTDGTCDRAIISNNAIYNCGAGITCNQTTTGYSFTITGNLIHTTTGSSTADGILTGGLGSFDALTIANNTIDGVVRHGIYSVDAGTTLAVTGNVIKAGTSNGWAGIYIRLVGGHVTTAMIEGNTVTGFTGGALPGIELARTSSYVFTNVAVYNNTVIMTTDGVEGFRINGNIATNVAVSNNLIKGLITDNSAGVMFPVRDNLLTGSITWGYTAAEMPRHMTATVTWNPDEIADGAIASKAITVTGAVVGDVVNVGFTSIVAAGWFLSGSVTSANTVTVNLLNKTGGPVTLVGNTLRVDVWQH